MREAGTATIEVAFRGAIGGFCLDAAFKVPARGVTALFGPSGCGKTTVLRCIAGLRRVADGVCRIDGQTWQDGPQFIATHRRPIGYVFQEASLFAHLSVRQNLLYGAGTKASREAIGFDEAISILNIAHLMDRAPRHLSGGERQRVAIGRALLSGPRLLLMDEPLSGLDGQTKAEILHFLERLTQTLSIPVIYVSHDMAEIERLADHLVLMERGRVVAAGPLAELQSDPALSLARSRTAAVSIIGTVESSDTDNGLTTISARGGTFLLTTLGLAVGDRCRLGISANDVSLSLQLPQQSTVTNVLDVTIISAASTGEFEMTVLLALGSGGDGDRFLARVTRRSWMALGLCPGLRLYAQVKAVALRYSR